MTLTRRATLLGGAASALGAGVAIHGSASSTALPTVPAVFISPHQDDELLSMGAAIMEHVALGRDVRVLLIGRGNKSSVRTSQELYDLIGRVPSESEFAAVRDREFQWSVSNLGAARILPSWSDRLDEKSFTPSAVAAIIRKYLPEGSDLKTLTKDAGEYHPDHVACHDAVASLYASGWTSLAPRYYALALRKQQAIDAGLKVFKEGASTPVTPLNQRPYKFENVAQVRWGIGYKSVKSFFDAQSLDPYSYRVQEV